MLFSSHKQTFFIQNSIFLKASRATKAARWHRIFRLDGAFYYIFFSRAQQNAESSVWYLLTVRPSILLLFFHLPARINRLSFSR